MECNKVIEYVSIYLRKSRDDGEYEDVLAKHRDTLVSYAVAKGWRFELYEEIASGESISYRPKMQALLRRVAKGEYDGVLVMDIDRLSRGSYRDYALIEEAFLASGTLIITPQRHYDWSIDTDEQFISMQALMSKTEYRMIKKRMAQGKVAGAKQGMWTNGKPPFPYLYDKMTKQLVVDQTKRLIYRLIIEKYLAGMSTQEISVWLTTEKIPTPAGKIPTGRKVGWSNVAVHRLLTHEVHLGYIVFSKTKGDGHKLKGGSVKKLPKEEWIISKGQHEPLKTQEEHQQILMKLAENNRVPFRSRARTIAMSGILYCKKCGRRMKLNTAKNAKGEQYHTALCDYTYPNGEKCNQMGRKLDGSFYAALYQNIIDINEAAFKEIREHDNRRQESLSCLHIKRKELSQHDEAIQRLLQGFEEGAISSRELAERKQAREEQRRALANEINMIEYRLHADAHSIDEAEFMSNIHRFAQDWPVTTTVYQQNKLLQSVVEKVIYDRQENGVVELEVLYR